MTYQEEVLPKIQEKKKISKRYYTVEELEKIIAKFGAVPLDSKDSRKLESSQGYSYCDGQCAAIVNTYSYNLFGVTLWTKVEIDQVPQANGEPCPCGDFTL
jgi:hypothetical protein